MKQLNYTYDLKNNFLNFLKSNNVDLQDDKILIQMFTSLVDKNKVESILIDIYDILPNIELIGASTAGEIINAKMQEKSIVLSISIFEKTSITTAYFDDKDASVLGLKMASALFKEDTKCLISFLDGLEYNGEDYLTTLASLNANSATLAGGMAGDLLSFKDTFIIYGDRVYESGGVGVSLNGKELEVYHDYNLGWRRVGPQFTITKSEANRVYEIDNQPIKEIYEQALGEEAVANMPSSTISFPLIKEENGILIARSMLNVFEDDSILYAGRLKEGEKVSFGLGSLNLVNVYNPTKELDLEHNQLQAAFIYSCSARKQFLSTELEKTFDKISQIAPASGFFTYGEFYSNKDKSAFLNITTTLLFLREKGTKVYNKKEARQSVASFKKSMTDDAMFHLLDYVSLKLSKQEKDLKSSKFKLDKFLDVLDSVVIISRTDLYGKIIYANELFEKISGYKKSELLGQPHNIVRNPIMDAEVFRDLWQTIQKGNIWQGIITNRAKDGSSYHVKSSIFPILDESGKTIEYMAIREDITSLIESQKSYENQIKFTDMLLDNEENIIAVTKNSVLNKINKAFFREYAYKDLESLLSWHECICDLFVEKEGYLKSIKKPDAWYKEVLQEPYKMHLAVMIDKHGEERIYSVKSNEVVYDEDTTYIIHTFNDITALEIAKQKAEKAEAAQAMFLANMSHEIRTPMNGILGFLELLETTNLRENQKKYVNIIDNSTKMLLKIINDILDSSKIANQKIELEKIEINPFIELSTAFELLRSIADQKSLVYSNKFDIEMSECILSDSTRLRQILINLISNAIKFTPEHGQVTFQTEVISSTQTHQKIGFSVQDSGIGIAKEKQESIFKAFTQADDSTTRQYGGTGLGLSISADLVKVFGGELRVESQEGKGSRFYFELLFEKCQDNDILKSYLMDREHVQSKDENNLLDVSLNILIAEDYDINRMLIEAIFQRYEKIDIEFAFDGEEVVQKAKTNRYDMIFMDVNMPKMNGIQATKKIRELGLKIPIIALTANALEGDKERFMQAGMDDYISKPINIEVLEKIILKYSSKIGAKNETSIDEEIYFDISKIIKKINSSLGVETAVTIKLLNAFASSLMTSSKELEEAFKIDDKESISNIVHKLKGSSLTLGLDDISQIMRKIEKNTQNRIKISYNKKIKKINAYSDLLNKGLTGVS